MQEAVVIVLADDRFHTEARCECRQPRPARCLAVACTATLIWMLLTGALETWRFWTAGPVENGCVDDIRFWDSALKAGIVLLGLAGATRLSHHREQIRIRDRLKHLLQQDVGITVKSGDEGFHVYVEYSRAQNAVEREKQQEVVSGLLVDYYDCCWCANPEHHGGAMHLILVERVQKLP
jgi:hypothetical protein